MRQNQGVTFNILFENLFKYGSVITCSDKSVIFRCSLLKTWQSCPHQMITYLQKKSEVSQSNNIIFLIQSCFYWMSNRVKVKGDFTLDEI